MLKKLLNFLPDQRSLARIQIALYKGSISKNDRIINIKDPLTWEFSGFSQNGEDGIIDVLLSKLVKKNNYIIEIGSSFGTENNSSWLIVVRKFNGLLIEGSKKDFERLSRLIKPYSIGMRALNLFVNKENVEKIIEKSTHLDPDVISVDIDGMDFHIVKELLERGFNPSIFVVEYNSVFGPTKKTTIPYSKDFNFKKINKTELYYGCSISLWRDLFSKYNYSFITVESKGVNAFFVNNDKFDKKFINGIKSIDFTENAYQQNKFNASYIEQYKLIENLKFLHYD